MVRITLSLCILLLLAAHRLLAVENVTNDTFNETPPTTSDIPNWQTGWAQPAVQPTGFTSTTGWNYVGTLGSETGVYLGNGWVITCAHVGAGNFVLNGVTYPMVPNSTQSFYNNGTPYDFLLFQVSPAPALPALPLRTSDPVAGSSRFALIGYGAGTQTKETWGFNTVTLINQTVPLSVFSTNDFQSNDNSTTDKYQLESGDSGGADFIFNSTSGQWELAGLNEAALINGQGTAVASAFVQLDTYAALIEPIVAPPAAPLDEPTMPQWGMLVLGASLVYAALPKLATKK